eukprot:TRINITY_DN2392_c0_g1_i1.p1 TRINITY_DN2392_c0_g1~~TRINITY_DN2392_c0_g1_i1.p1  ORF type:complete len:651 (+),score=131.02 TRINITY_DN2392_c0_g1_i1:666-2618(+)
MEYAFQRQLKWQTNFSIKKSKYYEEFLIHCRNSFLPFPYRLWKDIYDSTNQTAFDYYYNMIRNCILNDLNYSSIPNMTAADITRLLGISRNEFIDLVNEIKASKGFFTSKEKTLDSALPSHPIPMKEDWIKEWWIIKPLFNKDLSNISHEARMEFQLLISKEEQNNIVCVKDLRIDILNELYDVDSLFFEIPVEDENIFSVNVLKEFTMNTTQGDEFECLLYDLLILMDGTRNVEEIIHILDIDREVILTGIKYLVLLGVVERCESDILPQRDLMILCDNSLATLLMMGNLGSDLASFAVTLYETGKISYELLRNLHSSLSNVDDTTAIPRGLAAQYFLAARSFKKWLFFLISKSNKKFDLIQIESMFSLTRFPYQKRLSVYLESSCGAVLCNAPLNEPFKFDTRIPAVFSSPRLSSIYYCLSMFSDIPFAILPRGIIFDSMPQEFTDAEGIITVLSSKYEEEITLFKNGTVFQSLGSQIAATPALIIPASHDSVFACVPFPIPDTVKNSDIPIQIEHIPVKSVTLTTLFSSPKIDDFIREKVLKKCREVINCCQLNNSLGYIQLLCDSKQVSVINVHFGIPLTKDALVDYLQEMCHALDIFNSENLMKVSNVCKNYSESVLEMSKEFGQNELYPSEFVIKKGLEKLSSN